MILETNNFREACQNILFAIDSKNLSLYNETLELEAKGSTLYMNVTNREYYVTVKFALPEETTFKAAVNAKLFLSLVSKITSPEIEILLEGNAVKVKGNGEYKLPIIYNNDVMLELPRIDILNVTNSMTIDRKILQSILQFNSKELQRGVAVRPVQKYYYVDAQGCITFTSGACVNSFTLEKPVQLLLGEKVVKLFKLFEAHDAVQFSIGVDFAQGAFSLAQTKVKFEVDNVELTAILADTGLISSVPVDAIRGMATKTYPYTAVVDREELLQVINRLMLFNDQKNYGKLIFNQDKITIKDWSSENTEVITVSNECPSLTTYEAIINMDSLNLILKGCEDSHVTICFGDERSMVIKKQNISDIIPELKLQA